MYIHIHTYIYVGVKLKASKIEWHSTLNKIHIESYTTKMTFKYWFDITKLTILIWLRIYKKGWSSWFQNTTRSYIWCYKVQHKFSHDIVHRDHMPKVLCVPFCHDFWKELHVFKSKPLLLTLQQKMSSTLALTKQMLIFNPEPYLQNHHTQILEWTPRHPNGLHHVYPQFVQNH